MLRADSPEALAVALCRNYFINTPEVIKVEQRKLWRLEAYDPRKSNEWLPLREIGEDQLKAAEELRDELNKINAPVLLRIVPHVN